MSKREGRESSPHMMTPTNHSSESPEERSSDRDFFAQAGIAGAVLVVLLLLNWFPMTRASLWVDEMFSVITASAPVGEMLGRLGRYQPGFFDHPPLYFLMLHGWMGLGADPWFLRLPSLLFTAAALVVCAQMPARRGGSPWVVLAAILPAMLHPEILFQSANIRMYALVAMLSAIVVAALERLAEESSARGHWTASGVLAIALASGLYTSTFCLLVMPGLGLIGLAWLWVRSTRPAGWGLVGALALATALYIPWIPTLWRMLGAEGASDGGVPNGGGRGWVGLMMVITGFPTLVPYLVLGWGWLLGRDRAGAVRWLGWFGAFVLMPTLLLILATPETRSFSARYLIPGIVLLLMGAMRGMVGWWYDEGAGRVARLAIGLSWVLAVMGGLWIAKPSLWDPPRGWWQVAAILEAEVRPSEVIMTGAFLSGESLLFHLREPERFSFLHYQTKLDDFYLAARSGSVVWYVNAGPLPDAYRAILDRYFPYRHLVEFDERSGTPLMIYGKRPFRRDDGQPARFQEPIPLPYESSSGPVSGV